MKTFNTTIISFFLLFFSHPLFSQFSDYNLQQAVYEQADMNNDFELDEQEYQNLTFLNISNRNIYNLDGLEAFPNLEYLYCTNNNLTSINISKLKSIKDLNCANNQISSLILNKNITHLDCSGNLLTQINLNSEMYSLNCANNSIENIDVTNCLSLSSFNCSSNKLAHLDITKNSFLYSMDCSGNSNLLSICVSSISTANAKFTKDISSSWSDQCLWIPDPNFRNALINTPGLDVNSNGVIEINEPNTVMELNISNQGIQDLTGIEYFYSLQKLDCSLNEINRLNFSSNSSLTDLNVGGNLQLASLDINLNTQLKELNIAGVNNIYNLIVSHLKKLERLNCTNTFNLQTIDLSGASNLKYLNVSNTNLVTLDVSNNQNLDTLYCNSIGRTFTSINANNLPKITYINCSNNTLLSSINISNCPNLKILLAKSCGNLSSLSLSTNIGLEAINFSNSTIDSLDLTNNINLETVTLDRTELNSLNILGLTNLISLNIEVNNLVDLDCSTNTQIESIRANNNQLQEIILTNLSSLKTLKLFNNNLTNLDLSSSPNLIGFDAYNNPNLNCIEVEDVSANFIFNPENKIDNHTSYSIDCNSQVTSTSDDIKTTTFVISPNPVTGYLNITNSNNELIRIYSLTGNLLLTSNSEKVDVSTLPRGMYMIFQGNKSRKFMKE